MAFVAVTSYRHLVAFFVVKVDEMWQVVGVEHETVQFSKSFQSYANKHEGNFTLWALEYRCQLIRNTHRKRNWLWAILRKQFVASQFICGQKLICSQWHRFNRRGFSCFWKAGKLNNSGYNNLPRKSFYAIPGWRTQLLF